jgi:hypothetical protein
MANDEGGPTSKYPQINLNTGVSLAVFVLLAGLIFWSAGLKSEVGYHDQRIGATEVGLKELRLLVDNARHLQAQSDIKLEGRLVTLEGLLRDVINRLAMAERDRRRDPQNP